MAGRHRAGGAAAPRRLMVLGVLLIMVGAVTLVRQTLHAAPGPRLANAASSSSPHATTVPVPTATASPTGSPTGTPSPSLEGTATATPTPTRTTQDRTAGNTAPSRGDSWTPRAPSSAPERTPSPGSRAPRPGPAPSPSSSPTGSQGSVVDDLMDIFGRKR